MYISGGTTGFVFVYGAIFVVLEVYHFVKLVDMFKIASLWAGTEYLSKRLRTGDRNNYAMRS